MATDRRLAMTTHTFEALTRRLRPGGLFAEDEVPWPDDAEVVGVEVELGNQRINVVWSSSEFPPHGRGGGLTVLFFE